MNEKRDVRAFPVIAASILHLLESASTPQTFSDLFREARASEPVSCTALCTNQISWRLTRRLLDGVAAVGSSLLHGASTATCT